ncbi:conserved hypothetical protein [Candidatus Terasakiella magnetica]|nr:conserved hypothetical protein [Candidatus Terasakiella magnetica]
MIVIWDNRLSVGDVVLDAEHRRVVSLLNELDVALTVNAPAVVVEKALEALTRAIDSHFQRDAETGRVGEHAALAARAHRLLQDWRCGNHVVDRRSLMTLGQRWVSHIGRREIRTSFRLASIPEHRLAV